MSEQIKDGGPAFPVHERDWPGMTLRDYFAAKAMQGMLATDGETNGYYEPAMVAEKAYQVADAMLQARTDERSEQDAR